MNTKICTSIEQSKKLLNLGIDPSTADMWYSYYGNSKYNPTIAYKGQQWFLCQIRNSLHDDIPCWSLTALLELMPKTIDKQGVKFFLRILCHKSDWYIDYASLEQSYLYSSLSKFLLDASILIIEQLMQEGYVKVNK